MTGVQTCALPIYVYIVLEPVGSARLTFGDDRYYEFMCFDVLKVVQSPGYDHGHGEESRNGRDIKIDILDDYVRTLERFRTYTGVPGVTGTPGGLNGPTWALVETEGSKGSVGHAPQGPKRIDLGQGVDPLFPSPPLPFLPPLLLLLGKGGVLLLVGVGLPLLARLSLVGRLLPLLLHIRGKGHPIDNN